MPRAECGFPGEDGHFSLERLETFGPTIWATVSQPAIAGSESILSDSVPFLIDTGASESCIDAELAKTLQLPVIDKVPMCGIAGAHLYDVVLCQIVIPGVGHSMSGRFACVELSKGGQPHKALLGRDFLKHIVMIYDGASGRVTILK